MVATIKPHVGQLERVKMVLYGENLYTPSEWACYLSTLLEYNRRKAEAAAIQCYEVWTWKRMINRFGAYMGRQDLHLEDMNGNRLLAWDW